MKKKNTVLHVFFMVALILALAVFAAAQHEGHDPGGMATTSDDPLPGAKSHESNCQKVASLAAELDEEFDALVDVAAAAELLRAPSSHKGAPREGGPVPGLRRVPFGRRLKRKG